MIQVGTPFNENGSEGVLFDKDITDSESIESLREVIKKLEDIEEPEALNNEANISFRLDRPNEGVVEIWLYVFYQEDGSSILYNESSGYYALTKEYTDELKGILEQYILKCISMWRHTAWRFIHMTVICEIASFQNKKQR